MALIYDEEQRKDSICLDCDTNPGNYEKKRKKTPQNLRRTLIRGFQRCLRIRNHFRLTTYIRIAKVQWQKCFGVVTKLEEKIELTAEEKKKSDSITSRHKTWGYPVLQFVTIKDPIKDPHVLKMWVTNFQWV